MQNCTVSNAFFVFQWAVAQQPNENLELEETNAAVVRIKRGNAAGKLRHLSNVLLPSFEERAASLFIA